jgi:hypothetical protein
MGIHTGDGRLMGSTYIGLASIGSVSHVATTPARIAKVADVVRSMPIPGARRFPFHPRE